MDFSADIPAIYAMFGEAVTHTAKPTGATVSGLAVHNQPGAALFGNNAYTTEHTLRYMVGVFPSVKTGDLFTIGVVDYIVTDAPLSLLDGAERLAVLSKKP